VEIAQSGLHSEDGINTDSTICEIRNVLHELLSSVQESSQLSSRMATRIGELELVLSNVNASLRKVEKIADEARIVGLNGRLEAARAGQYGAAFNVVANETKNLGVHAADTSSSIRLLVDKLDESLKSVSAELQSRMSLDAETVKNSQNTVSRLLDQLGLMHHGMTSSLHRTEAVSESLSQEIGRSVMALQFQDRVNQRIDHVVEALVALRENLTPFEREVSPTRVEARAGDWRQWLESRSTMKSERDVISSSGSAAASGGNSDFGSIELF
jgi:methyl-accepting chemotaxis protein